MAPKVFFRINVRSFLLTFLIFISRIISTKNHVLYCKDPIICPLNTFVVMGSTLNYFLIVICLTGDVFPKFRVVEVEDEEERLEAEVFSVNSSSSGDYSSGRECGGVGIRCSVHQSDRIVPNTCRFRFVDNIKLIKLYSTNRQVSKWGHIQSQQISEQGRLDLSVRRKTIVLNNKPNYTKGKIKGSGPRRGRRVDEGINQKSLFLLTNG